MNRLLMLLAVLVTAAPAIAQDRDRVLDEKTLAAARDLGRTVLTWVRSEVLPQAQQWKSRLDAAMSADDLRQLNALRARATALRQRAVAVADGMRTAWQTEDYQKIKAARAELKRIGEERAALAGELKPLAIRYKETLQAIGTDARPRVKQWMEHGRELGARWYSEHKDELSPRAAQAIGRLMNRRGDLMQMLAPDMRQKVIVARFMLWDGSDFTQEIEQKLERGEFGQGGMRLR